MDPITAVGFAASILNFVDYSHKVVTGTIEVFKSGKTSKNGHISEVISDLNDAAKDLAKVPPGRSVHEKTLHQLSASCQEVAKELTTLLAKLSTTPEHSKWISARVALRSMRKEGKVAELESTLDSYRSQILLRLIQIVSDQQLHLQVELCGFRTQARDQGSKTLDELRSLRTELLDVIETSLRASKRKEEKIPAEPQGHEGSNSGLNPVAPNVGEQLAQIDELRQALDRILEKKDTPTPEMRILQQLWLDDMYAREDNIHEAEGSTFEWILDNGQGNEGQNRDGETKINREAPNDTSEPAKLQHQELDDATNQRERSDNGTKEKSSSASLPRSSLNSQATPNTRERGLIIRTRSTFQAWLRKGGSVFHISGKAGSGKSTLMKLIVNDQRTYKFLEGWAGEKELVTAQFFFWRAGSETQRSRKGLYRSLLFETLKKCPHLIQDVFPEAHSAFKKKSRENYIDQLLFRAEYIEEAFRKLVSLPSSLGCRICLFIDGLDEYGDDSVDNYEYEKLAKNLITWTKNSDIKILASSRPYQEFLDAFPEDLRIHLHKINANDIQSFSRQMFEADDQFSLVKDHYQHLVWRIVEYSAGVFLWARLVARSLIISIHRGDPVEALENQLKVTPKDITKLYEHFFNSISKADQERAFKMLLLFTHCNTSFYGRFNAMFLSWLDQLQDPNFPMNYPMEPYTDQEIQDRLEKVKRQIAGLTHGLLESTTSGVLPNSLAFGQRIPFFDRRIQFFHRTAREFVLENLQLRKFHTDHPEITESDTYLRLDLAELWFSAPGTIDPRNSDRCMGLSANYSEKRPGPGRLEAVAKVRKYHNSDASSLTFPSRELIVGGVFIGSRISLYQRESTLHYILSNFDVSEYLETVAYRRNQLLKEEDELCCLLSFLAYGYTSYRGLRNIRKLLSLGVSPTQHILVHYSFKGSGYQPSPDKTKVYVPVWSIFIARLIDLWKNVRNYRPGGLKEERIWEFLELLLEHGGRGDTFCLFDESGASSNPTHVISLLELIQQCKPRNEESLVRLINKSRKRSLRFRMKEKFRHIKSKDLGKAFDPTQYKPFHINMWPPPNSPPTIPGAADYILYSVWAEGHETKTDGLTFRVF